MVLLDCEADGFWMPARLRGALPHAVFNDPFRVWIPANTNNKFRFCKALCYIVKEKPGTHTDPNRAEFLNLKRLFTLAA